MIHPSSRVTGSGSGRLLPVRAMTAPDVLFVTVCGIGTVNSLFLATYLLRTSKGERLLNRLFAALVLTFSFRVGKSVAMLFLAPFHPVFELLWIAALAATGSRPSSTYTFRGS